MARLRVVPPLLVIGLALVALVPVGAQPFGGGYYLIADTPLAFANQLRRAVQYGYAFAAVARPEGRLLPNTVAVLVTRSDATGASTPDLEVVVARPGPIDDFQDAVNATAKRGFRMVGLTYTAAVWGSANDYTPVAIMSRVPAGEAPEYRIIRTRYDRDQRATLNAAGAAGFVVSDLFSYPIDATTTDSVPVYVAEKTTVTPAVRYHLTFDETAAALESSLDRYAGEGYRLHGLWTANIRIVALLAKPLEGAWPEPRDYKVDDPSTLFFSRTFGGLAGVVLRHRDRFLGVWDLKSPRTEYTVTTGQIADAPNRPFPVTERRKALFLEKLDSDGEGGYAPFEFTVKAGSGRNLDATVLLRRARP